MSALLNAAAPDLLAVALSIKVNGPDADGLVWMEIEDGRDGMIAVNLGKAAGPVARTALLFEECRAAAVIKAGGEA